MIDYWCLLWQMSDRERRIKNDECIIAPTHQSTTTSIVTENDSNIVVTCVGSFQRNQSFELSIIQLLAIRSVQIDSISHKQTIKITIPK